MRAAVVTGFGAPLQVSEFELPAPGYGEALVKWKPPVSVTPICMPRTAIGR